MNDEQERIIGVGEREPAILEQEVLRLRQAIAELISHQDALLDQYTQLQAQIVRSDLQAEQALAAQREDLVHQAQQQRQQAQTDLANLQAQLDQLAAQKQTLAGRQVALLSALAQQRRQQEAKLPSRRSFSWVRPASATKGIGQPGAPAPRKRFRRLLVVSGLALLVLLVTLSNWRTVLTLLAHAPQPTATARALPTFAPTPTPDPPAFTANGTGPSEPGCDLGGSLCYNPEQIQQAFSVTALYKEGYDGRGQTIVILGVGYTTTLQSDLQQFDQAWGLPDPPTFQILQPHGPPAPYTCAGNYDALQFENTLDVEWAHALAPGANITLVIGENGGGSPAENCVHRSIPNDVTYALDHHLGNIISISYGGSELGDVSESAAEHAADRQYYLNEHTVFERAASMGVTVLASTGDEGATNSNDLTKTESYWSQPNVAWPASDPDVLAVGGTILALESDGAVGTYGDEVVWNEPNYAATGGGLSQVFPEPDYQQTVPDQSLFQGRRGVPDVAFPAEDAVLYESFEPGYLRNANAQWSHWDLAGGTSLSAPCWAGLMAIADQMRGSPLGLIQPFLYHLRGQGFHDIIYGDNSFGGVQGYPAQPGYDLASGLGTPIADQLVPALLLVANHSSCLASQHACI